MEKTRPDIIPPITIMMVDNTELGFYLKNILRHNNPMFDVLYKGNTCPQYNASNV